MHKCETTNSQAVSQGMTSQSRTQEILTEYCYVFLAIRKIFAIAIRLQVSWLAKSQGGLK